MRIQKLIAKRRLRRKSHVRKNIFGTAEKLRMSISRSINHIGIQLIDDVAGKTVLSLSSRDKEVRGKIAAGTKKTEISKIVGVELAKKALAANIKTVVFDRNGYLYHGRVKALADAARQEGLEL